MKKQRVVIVHGILTHGDGGIDRIGEKLQESGYEVDFFEYPIRSALRLYWPGTALADGAALANFQRDGDHVIAHSYGCLIWQNSIKAGAKWEKCFLFGGAATSDQMFYPDDSLKEAHVVYNPEDKALFLGSLLPFHPFGKLGFRGYTGQPGRKDLDRRFKNVRGFKSKWWQLNHSHYWGGDAPFWLKYIREKLCKCPYCGGDLQESDGRICSSCMKKATSTPVVYKCDRCHKVNVVPPEK